MMTEQSDKSLRNSMYDHAIKVKALAADMVTSWNLMIGYDLSPYQDELQGSLDKAREAIDVLSESCRLCRRAVDRAYGWNIPPLAPTKETAQ